ncbi:unnamed protein product [Somion occarium]|uniref:NmrA-like domain-containing protein n=1 Tax=Somion occarium TaxID=3059160 RepID=A0ABP1CY17_9APHY
MEMDDPRNEYQEFLSAIEDNASGGSFTNALIHLQYKYRVEILLDFSLVSPTRVYTSTSADAMSRKILITGATGKQGRALISSLHDSDFQLLALTRNPSSPSADSLKAHPHVELIQGDLDKPETIRKVFEDAGGKASIWGVFAVLAFPGMRVNPSGEERQGILLAELALEYQVGHFVYSSVDRSANSDDEGLILDRGVKVNIEKHVKSLGEKGLNWTILRPAACFMENFDGFAGRITYTLLRCVLKPDVKVQLMATNDIGCLAAEVFKNPQAATHKVLVVTSDILTPSEMDAAHIRATGQHMPCIPDFLGRLLLAIGSSLKEPMQDMERMHQRRLEDPNGYDAHLAEAKALLPDMTSFEEWMKQRTNANSSSSLSMWIWKLLTGRPPSESEMVR